MVLQLFFSVFSDYDPMLTVQEVEEENIWSKKLEKRLRGVGFKALDNVRAVLLRSKSVSEKPLPLLPDNLYDKFVSTDLSPATKITFPSDVSLWLPLSKIPMDLRLLALIPEARGYLLGRAIEFYQNYGKLDQFFSISYFTENSSAPLSDRVHDLCAFTNFGYGHIVPWIQTSSSSVEPCGLKALSSYIFYKEKDAYKPFPETLERAKVTYTLYVSINQQGNSFKFYAPEATQSGMNYQIFDAYSAHPHDRRYVAEERSKMAIYRCEESQRRRFNAKNNEYHEVAGESSLSLGPMSQACSPNFVAFCFILSVHQSCRKLKCKEFFRSFEEAKNEILNLEKKLPLNTSTVQKLYEAILWQEGPAYHSEKSASFKISGLCSVAGQDETFEFCIATLSDEFDLSKPFSSTTKAYLEGKLFNNLRAYSGQPIQKDAVMENVRIWNIQFPSYFMKSYPDGMDESVKK